jgi:hypothetical protein
MGAEQIRGSQTGDESVKQFSPAPKEAYLHRPRRGDWEPRLSQGVNPENRDICLSLPGHWPVASRNGVRLCFKQSRSCQTAARHGSTRPGEEQMNGLPGTTNNERVDLSESPSIRNPRGDRIGGAPRAQLFRPRPGHGPPRTLEQDEQAHSGSAVRCAVTGGLPEDMSDGCHCRNQPPLPRCG